MDQIDRLKIGVFYNFDDQWIAGSNYIINFLLSISLNNLLGKISIQIICKDADRKHIDKFNIPNLTFYDANTQVHFSVWERIINRIYRLFSGKNLLHGKKVINQLDVDYVFPVQLGMWTYQEIISHNTTPIFWIPDFQDKYFPDFFSSEELKEREMFYQTIIHSCSPVVFSSYACLSDFKKYYPDYKNATLVYRFRSESISLGSVTENITVKYELPEKFFFCPNQFWKHKNQKIVLEALLLLKKQDSEVFVVFSGKETDYRNPGYITEIKEYIKFHELENVKLLGFIPEEDKKSLFHRAHAIVQPSLFEGWSTLVEEAKTLGKHIVLSDIPVHREQIEKNCTFFNPYDAFELSNKLLDIWSLELYTEFDFTRSKEFSDIENLLNDLLEMKVK